MNRTLRKIIPKVPQWRWVILCLDSGRPISIPDKYIDGFNKLHEYIKENYESIEEAFECVDVYSQEAEEAVDLNKIKPVRNIIRKLISERADVESIIEVLDFKFRIKTTPEILNTFKILFWDVDVVNTYEMAQFLHSLEESEVAPPTLGRYRKSYTEFNQGVDVVLEPKEILRHMMNRAFFRSEELFKTGNDMLAIRAQRAAMDIAKNLRLFNPENQDEALSDIYTFSQEDKTEEFNEDDDIEIPENIIRQ